MSKAMEEAQKETAGLLESLNLNPTELKKAQSAALANRIIELPINLIRQNRNQPRGIFEEEKIKELASTIERIGLMQPITVRPVAAPNPELNASQYPGHPAGGYELIAGERRYRAHLFLGKETIKAIIDSATDDEMLLKSLIENLQREDLSVMEKANGLFRLMQDHKLKTVDEAAKLLGWSRATGFRYARIARSDEQHKKIIADHKLELNDSDFFLSIVDQVKASKTQELIRAFDEELKHLSSSEKQINRASLMELHQRFCQEQAKEEKGTEQAKGEHKNSARSAARNQPKFFREKPLCELVRTKTNTSLELWIPSTKKLTGNQKLRFRAKIREFCSWAGIKL